MRKRLLSGLLAVSMMFSLFPVSAFAEDTGGGISPDAVSMQEVDTENDAADPQYTQVFKVADTASEADGTVTFADAVNAINQDTSGNYLIELADDINLLDTHFVIKANTTILGENHTIHFGAEPIALRGIGTVLNLGRNGYDKTLTLTGGTGECIISLCDLTPWGSKDGSYVLNLYNGVTFEDNYPSLGVIFTGYDSTVNMYGNSCIKAASDIILVDGRMISSDVLNMYDTSCLDGCNISAFAYDHGTGALNMYDQSTIKNFILRKNYTQTWYAVRAANCTMNDNSRIENCGGGGIRIENRVSGTGTFTMNGGSITNCSDGGVLLRNGSSFTMNGGSITNCSARTNGGGVYADGSYGSFTMNGGSITGCSAINGGGVYMAGYHRNFTMNGGSITDCSAKNSGGGVYVSSDNSLTCQDGAVICNNKADQSAADIYLGIRVTGVTLPDAASMNRTYQDTRKKITGWYLDPADNRYTPAEDAEAVDISSPLSGELSLVASCLSSQEPIPDVDPDISDTDDTGSAIGAGIATGVFVSGATYLIGTNIWLNAIYDFVPTNRIQLAVALWNKADCPAPVSTELYPDIDADDTDAQAAARWCVEQGLMKDYHETDKDGNEEVTFKPYRYMFRPQAIKAWYDLEALQREQQ